MIKSKKSKLILLNIASLFIYAYFDKTISKNNFYFKK